MVSLLSSKSTAIVQCDYEMIWSSASGMEEAGQQVQLKSWIPGEITLASSRIFLEESHGSRLCREQCPKELVNKYSSIISSRLKTSASW